MNDDDQGKFSYSCLSFCSVLFTSSVPLILICLIFVLETVIRSLCLHLIGMKWWDSRGLWMMFPFLIQCQLLNSHDPDLKSILYLQLVCSASSVLTNSPYSSSLFHCRIFLFGVGSSLSSSSSWLVLLCQTSVSIESVNSLLLPSCNQMLILPEDEWSESVQVYRPFSCNFCSVSFKFPQSHKWASFMLTLTLICATQHWDSYQTP